MKDTVWGLAAGIIAGALLIAIFLARRGAIS